MADFLSIEDLLIEHDCPYCSLEVGGYGIITDAQGDWLRMGCSDLKGAEKTLRYTRDQIRKGRPHPAQIAKLRDTEDAILRAMARIRQRMNVLLGFAETERTEVDLWA